MLQAALRRRRVIASSPCRGQHVPQQETCMGRGIMATVSRQAKTVRPLVRCSPFASLVLVRRDVINGGSVRAARSTPLGSIL